ncbi:hypothetical protein [Peribacillus butanolivorans]
MQSSELFGFPSGTIRDLEYSI